MPTNVPPVTVFSTNPPLSGFVAPGFESVKDQFLVQLRDGKGTDVEEIGASFAAFHKGECVVCLFGGYADQAKTKLFDKDTLTVIFSSGKVIESILTVQQVSAGRLGWDQKIASIWPEFATGNKENVTVKDLLEHQGGVAGMDKGFNPNLEEAKDLDKLAVKIARQPHNSGGKLVKSYHALTRGWYTNELVRRADTKHRSQGTILREEINPRLGIEIYTGLPPNLHDRVSKVVMHSLHMNPPPRLPPTTIDRNSVIPNIADFTRAMVKTGVTGLKDLIREPKNEGNYANSKAVQECETPSAFTVTNAFSMAKLASVMSRKGEGWLMDEKTWKEAHTIETRNLDVRDTVTGGFVRTTWGGWASSEPGVAIPQTIVDKQSGRVKDVPAAARKSGWEWTGWAGNGGSIMQWCPEHELAIGYVPNLMHLTMLGDERSMNLTLKVMEGVEKREGKAKI